jgi:hypothetical protein
VPVQAPDPTLDFLRRLDDPAQFIRVDNVPVFRAHQRGGKNGDTVKIADADLGTILWNTQRLEVEDGVVGRLTLGHTIPGAPQTQQPPIVGYVRFTEVGRFGPGGKPAIKVSVYYDRRFWDQARSYPYRSAEYYPQTQTLVGVALLKTDPMLDLGMVAYSRDWQSSDGFPVTFEGVPMVDPTLPPDAAAPPPGAKPPGPATPPGPEGVDPQFHESFMRCAKHHFPKLFAAEAPAMPEPPMPGPAAPPAPAPAPGPAQFARTGNPLYDTLHYELLQQRQATAQLTLNYERERCGRLCDQLDALGYQYDRADALSRMVACDDAGRARLVDSIKRYSRQDPTMIGGGAFLSIAPLPAAAAAGVPDPENVITKKHADAAILYQRRHDGCGWDEAVEKTRGTK